MLCQTQRSFAPGDQVAVIIRSSDPRKRAVEVALEKSASKAMHTELAAMLDSLYHVTRANRVIAVVRQLKDERRMTERWIGVVISVSRYVSDDQPGIIECELCDAYGHLWTFIDKQSAVGRSDLDAETVYPQPGHILCKVVGRTKDASERDLIEIELYGVISIDNEERFEVFPAVLVEGVYDSSTQCPWNGHEEPNATFN